MLSLRDYQSTTLNSVAWKFAGGKRRVLLVSPTGSGKTVMFAFVTLGALKKGRTVFIIAHRHEILDQICKTLDDVGVEYGRVAPDFPLQPNARVQVCSVQTLARRLHKLPAPDFIVVDEAHHSAAGTWAKVFSEYPKAKILGVTATPERLDGKGLSNFFDEMVLGPSVSWLIEQGFLAQPVYFAPEEKINRGSLKKVAGDFSKEAAAALMDEQKIHGNVIQCYREHANGVTAVAFCSTIDHAAHTASAFRSAGIPAATIDGTMSRDQRNGIIGCLREGTIKVMASCELVSEGFDLPAVGAAILLRPTDSLALHLQQIGRVLRPAPGKANAVILDHVGNCVEHGLAEFDREWSLEGHAKKKKKLTAKECPKCFAVYASSQCPNCGFHPVRAINPTDDEFSLTNPGRLAKLEAAVLQAQNRRELGEARTFEAFLEIARQRGYKPQWAHFRWRASRWNPRNSGTRSSTPDLAPLMRRQ